MTANSIFHNIVMYPKRSSVLGPSSHHFIHTQSKIFQHLATIRHTQAWPVVEKCVLVEESKTNTSLFFYLDFGFPTQYYEGLGV